MTSERRHRLQGNVGKMVTFPIKYHDIYGLDPHVIHDNDCACNMAEVLSRRVT